MKTIHAVLTAIAILIAITLSSCSKSLTDQYDAATPAPICGGNNRVDRVPLFAGSFSTSVIREDGSLWDWGNVYPTPFRSGSDVVRSDIPLRFGRATDWASAFSNDSYRILLRRDGSLWSNFDFISNHGVLNKPLSPVNTDCDWAQFAAHDRHILAIKTDGSLWAWGDNEFGQLGDGSTETRASPVRIGNESNWKSVSTGWHNSFAVKTDGTLWAWGEPRWRLLAKSESTAIVTAPKQADSSTDWRFVAVGSNDIAALKTDNSLWTLGDYQGELEMLGYDVDWSSVSIGGNHLLAIKNDGTLWAAGDNSYGQLGTGHTRTDYPHYCAVEIISCGTKLAQIGTESDWKGVAAGSGHSVAVKRNGAIFTWGDNILGQLGNGQAGSRAQRDTPTHVGGENDWKDVGTGFTPYSPGISSGGMHQTTGYTIALKNDGTLWAWGGNDYGQLGDGTRIHRSLPAQIGADTDWSKLAVGARHSLAIKNDGSLWSWGDGTGTGYGLPYESAPPKPTRIGSDADWAIIAAGSLQSAAIKTNGTLWAWGFSLVGGSVASAPTQIGFDTTWTHVALGGSHAVALKSDGTLWTWGWNYNGQLGDGTTIDRNEPTQIGTDHDWTAAEAGGNITVGLKKDGTLWAWGWLQSSYSIGEEPPRGVLRPVQIGSSADWTRLLPTNGDRFRAVRQDDSTWEYSSNSGRIWPFGFGSDWSKLATLGAGVKSDGSLWTWGQNIAGELGIGVSAREANVLSPIEITFR